MAIQVGVAGEINLCMGQVLVKCGPTLVQGKRKNKLNYRQLMACVVLGSHSQGKVPVQEHCKG